MLKITTKIPRRYKAILFCALFLSWSTGVIYYILNKWVRVTSKWGGENYHPLQSIVREAHGAAAFIMMIIYGYLLATHVSISIKQKRQRTLGLSLLLIQLVLIITGYLLYYINNKQYFTIIKNIHFIVGVLFPLTLICHICSGISNRRTKTTRS